MPIFGGIREGTLDSLLKQVSPVSVRRGIIKMEYEDGRAVFPSSLDRSRMRRGPNDLEQYLHWDR